MSDGAFFFLDYSIFYVTQTDEIPVVQSVVTTETAI